MMKSRTVRPSTVAALVVFALLSASAQTADPINKIREADIKSDLFTLASDAMRGREGGTLDEMAASAWVAERAREAGLQPAGDNGTYFQFFPLERFRVSASSVVTLDDKPLHMGRDVITEGIFLANVDAPVTVADADTLDGAALKDRVLAVRYAPAEQASQDSGPRTQAALRVWLRALQQKAAPSAPAAIVVIVPDAAVDQWNRVSVAFPRGSYGLDQIGRAHV